MTASARADETIGMSAVVRAGWTAGNESGRPAPETIASAPASMAARTEATKSRWSATMMLTPANPPRALAASTSSRTAS